MAGRQGQRLVRAASLADRQQLHSGRCHQPARDVAGGHIQSRADRKGAGLGPGHRHEHHARVPARPAVAAGRTGIHAAHRTVPGDRGAARHQAAAGVLRLLLGSESEAGTAAPADPGRAQFGLGAEPGPRGTGRYRQLPQTESLCAGRHPRFCQRPAHPRLGLVERAGQRRGRQVGGRTRKVDSRCRAAAAGIRVGARGQSLAAADFRRLAQRRLVEGQVESHRTRADRAIRHRHVPHL